MMVSAAAFGFRHDDVQPAPPVTPATVDAWLDVVRDLPDSVPARELLGGPAISSELTSALADHDVSAAAFRARADAMREQAASHRNLLAPASVEIADALANIQLPKGVTAPTAPVSMSPQLSPAEEMADVLLDRLIAGPPQESDR
ncbi:MAG: hypothetical protein CMJ83_16935 [Planctomycetes bacterium]|nr:hypothetical protein [Planctomycetota bacterium]